MSLTADKNTKVPKKEVEKFYLRESVHQPSIYTNRCWRPVTVAGVKYLRFRVTRRQPLYETFGHYIRDWSLAYSFMTYIYLI